MTIMIKEDFKSFSDWNLYRLDEELMDRIVDDRKQEKKRRYRVMPDFTAFLEGLDELDESNREDLNGFDSLLANLGIDSGQSMFIIEFVENEMGVQSDAELRECSDEQLEILYNYICEVEEL